jgi:hypothetical protein
MRFPRAMKTFEGTADKRHSTKYIVKNRPRPGRPPIQFGEHHSRRHSGGKGERPGFLEPEYHPRQPRNRIVQPCLSFQLSPPLLSTDPAPNDIQPHQPNLPGPHTSLPRIPPQHPMAPVQGRELLNVPDVEDLTTGPNLTAPRIHIDTSRQHPVTIGSRIPFGNPKAITPTGYAVRRHPGGVRLRIVHGKAPHRTTSAACGVHDGQKQHRRGVIIVAEQDINLTADLANLHEAGIAYLPLIADQFAAARQQLGVNETQDDRFWRPAEFMGGGNGPVQKALANMRDTMAAVLVDSESNMRDTGRALVTASVIYGDEDALNAELIRRGLDPSAGVVGQG